MQKTSWKAIPTNTQGLTRFKDKNSGASAYIQRNSDGTVLAQCKTGFMGRMTTLDELQGNPSDDVILSKFEDTVNPPTYSDWEATKKPGVYEGKAGDWSAKAVIERDGGQATVKISSGPFGIGPSSETFYFAPAPSDAQILDQHR